MRAVWVLAWLCVCVGSVACGDDGAVAMRDAAADVRADAAVDSGPPESGVDAASRLLDLSAEDSARVCGALSRRFDRLLSPSAYRDVSCTQQAWPVSFDFSNITGELMGSPARCKQLVAMCVDRGGALGDFTPASSLGADLIDPVRCTQPRPGLDLESCEATVGDLESCGAAAVAELGARLPHATCDALGDRETLERANLEIDLAQLPECQALTEHCPVFTLDTQPDGRPPTAAQ